MKLFIFMLLVVFTLNSTLAEMTGRQVMEEQKKRHEIDTEYENQIMILQDKDGNKEKRIVKRWSKKIQKDVYKTLLAFLEPKDIHGTALLTHQQKDKKKSDDQWLYLPATGKPKRIAKGSMKKYFLGTDYQYCDLSPEKLDDYKYSISNNDVACGKKNAYKCYVVEATPVSKKVKKKSCYSKRILSIRKDIYVTVKTEYYDKRKKKHVKTQIAQDFYQLEGTKAWRAKKAIMDNLSKKHKTAVASVSIKANSEIKDKIFTEQYLKNNEHTK